MKKLILKYQAILFPILDIALNGANYLFHVYVAWHLTTSNYGIINALISFSSILLVAGVSFQLYTAKYIAEGGLFHSNSLAFKIKEMRKTAFFIVAAISSLFLVFIVPIHNFTRGDYTSLIILLIIFIMNVFLSINRGIIQGTRQFIHLNISFYVEVGAKIFLVFFLLRSFEDINSVLISIALGMLVSLVHSISVTNKIISTSSENVIEGQVTGNSVKEISLEMEISTEGRVEDGEGVSTVVYNCEEKEKKKSHLGKILAVFAANFFTYFFTSLDMLVVNYFLPDTSGYFAVVLKYSQILLFASASIITVFIPGLSMAKGNKPLFLDKIKKMAALIFFMIFIVVFAYYFLAAPTVDIFFGKQYSRAKDFVLLNCIPYTLLILNFIAINIHVIFDNKKYLWVLMFFGVALTVLLIAFHGGLKQIFIIESLVYGLMLLAQSALLIREVNMYNK